MAGYPDSCPRMLMKILPLLLISLFKSIKHSEHKTCLMKYDQETWEYWNVKLTSSTVSSQTCCSGRKYTWVQSSLIIKKSFVGVLNWIKKKIKTISNLGEFKLANWKEIGKRKHNQVSISQNVFIQISCKVMSV